MLKYFLIFLFIINTCSYAGMINYYDLNFEIIDNGVFVFVLEGTGRAQLDINNMSIPMFKGSNLKRRSLFYLNNGYVGIHLEDTLSLTDIYYKEIDNIPSGEIFFLDTQENLHSDFLLNDPDKKFRNEIKYLNFKVRGLLCDRALSVYINNMLYSFVSSTGKDRWSDRISINIYPYLEKNQYTDIISFVLCEDYEYDSPVEITDLDFSMGFIIPDNQERGYLPNGCKNNPNFIIYNYNDYDPDQYLSFYIFGNTEDNPVRVYFNNNLLKVISGMSKFNEWSGLVKLKIPEWMLIRGNNTILFENLHNTNNPLKKNWGIKYLYQSVPKNTTGIYGDIRTVNVNENYADRLLLPLDISRGGTELRFRLFNNYRSNIVTVYLNDKKLQQYENTSGENQWSEEMILDVKNDLYAENIDNILIFKRNDKKNDWAIDITEIFHRASFEEIPVKYSVGEFSLSIKQIPEMDIKEPVCFIEQAVVRSGLDASTFESTIKDTESNNRDIYDESGYLFSFESLPSESMIYVGGNPLFSGRFIGYSPFYQEIFIPERTYIYVRSPRYGSSIYFHNPLFEFPIYSYYFNIKPRRQFNGRPFIQEINIAKINNYNILNSAPFYCDYDLNGFNNIIIGTSEGIIYIYKQTGPYEYTELADIIKIEDHSYIVPFFLDFNNNGSIDLVAGTLDGDLLLFSRDEKNIYRFTDYILRDILKNKRLEGITPFFFDLNNNRKKDLIFGTSYDGLFYSLNEGTDSAPVFNRINKIKLPFDYPEHTVPTVFYDYSNGTFSIVFGSGCGYLIMLSSPQILENNLTFDNISIMVSPDTLSLGFDLVPRVLDFNDDGSYEVLIGNRQGEILLLKYETKE